LRFQYEEIARERRQRSLSPFRSYPDTDELHALSANNLPTVVSSVQIEVPTERDRILGFSQRENGAPGFAVGKLRFAQQAAQIAGALLPSISRRKAVAINFAFQVRNDQTKPRSVVRNNGRGSGPKGAPTRKMPLKPSICVVGRRIEPVSETSFRVLIFSLSRNMK
jgi:hypothetical protein